MRDLFWLRERWRARQHAKAVCARLRSCDRPLSRCFWHDTDQASRLWMRMQIFAESREFIFFVCYPIIPPLRLNAAGSRKQGSVEEYIACMNRFRLQPVGNPCAFAGHESEREREGERREKGRFWSGAAAHLFCKQFFSRQSIILQRSSVKREKNGTRWWNVHASWQSRGFRCVQR